MTEMDKDYSNLNKRLIDPQVLPPNLGMKN